MNTPYSDTPAFPLAPAQALKVRGDTNIGSLAKSITLTLLERQAAGQRPEVLIRAMGPHAVNQMVKGLIEARKQLVSQAKDLTYQHGWDSHVEGEDAINVIQTVVRLAE